MNRLNQGLANLVSFFYLLIYLAFILDSYKNPTKFLESTHLNPAWLMLLLILINFLLVFKQTLKLPKAFILFNNFLIFPISFFLGSVLSIMTYFSPPNSIYSIIPLNSQQLILLSIGSLATIIINTKFSIIYKHFKLLLFLIPIVSFFYFWLVRLWPNDIFKEIVKEDHLIENTQFIFLVFAFITAFSISKEFFRKKLRVMFVIYLLLGFAVFFIAGEEISWGQRIIGLTTPSDIAQINSQKELTVHNLYSVVSFNRLLYMILGFYGTLSWLSLYSEKIRKLKFHNFFITDWYLFFFFFPIAIYNLSFPTTLKIHPYNEWAEVTELYLYFGILTFLVINYIKLKTWRKI